MTIRSNHRAATSILVASLTLLTACASSPLERRQVVLYSEAEMAARGAAAYSQMREETSASEDARATRYVQCVADHVVEALPEAQRNIYHLGSHALRERAGERLRAARRQNRRL